MTAFSNTKTVKTTCPYCGVGCGVLATPQADGSVDIKGDPEHPANFGRLCSKGSSLGETLSLDDRILHPQVGGKKTDWSEALDLVAENGGVVTARMQLDEQLAVRFAELIEHVLEARLCELAPLLR